MAIPAFTSPIPSVSSPLPSSCFVGQTCLRAPSKRARPPSAALRRATPLASAGAGPLLVVGDVIAVGRGGSLPELGVVTGTDSAGLNVDFQPLEAFVPELYVHSKDAPSFVRADRVRKVPSTYVADQSGWIVLDVDVDQALQMFKQREMAPKATVVEAPPREISAEALKKQGFLRPTKMQAFVGAAISVPVSALAYSVFAGERAAFGGLDKPGALQDVALVGAASVSVLSIVVGCALFLYAVNYSEKSE